MLHPHDNIYGWSARQAWLAAALAEATAWAASRGRSVPQVLLHPSMALGYNDTRGLWRCGSNEPNLHHIFLSESLHTVTDVLIVLLHELAHALEPGQHHGPRFIRCLKEFGIVRKRRNEHPDVSLQDWINSVCQKLGPYPVPADRRLALLRPWDFYERQVCWCPDCEEVAYKTPSQRNGRDFSNPLKPSCTASSTATDKHRTVLCATLPLTSPYPDLPPRDQPDFRIEPHEVAYIQLESDLRQQTPALKAWAAFHLIYDRAKPWHRLVGIFRDRDRATKLTEHLRGLNARSFDVREVSLHYAEPLFGTAPGTFVTMFDVKTNPLLVSEICVPGFGISGG